jgi:hypothetical protein
MIFGELPEMLKQQVLEFAGATTSTPFRLSYSPKTKTIVQQLDCTFLKEVIEYKIRNPPECTYGGDDNVSIMFIHPLKKQRYGLLLYPFSSTILLSSKYKRFYIVKKRYDVKNPTIMDMMIMEMMLVQLNSTTNIIFCD